MDALGVVAMKEFLLPTVWLLMWVLLALLVVVVYGALNPPPHVLVIVVDDLGWNDVSFRGAEYSTPVIDDLAASGILLDQYYVQPICSPTRAALLSSRYPYRDGLAHLVICNGRDEGLPTNIPLLPGVMKRAGYSTHAVGKWDVGYTHWSQTPTYHGFDTFLGFYGCHESYYRHAVSPDYERHGCVGVDLHNNTEPLLDTHTYSTHLYTAETMRIISAYNEGDAPMFFYLAYQAVHTPLQVPRHYITHTDCAFIPETNRAIYCGMLKAVDEGIGNVTSLLKERGLYDNTLIVFTTDNGGQNGAGGNNWPLRGNKATVFEGGVRANGFVSWPEGIPHHKRNTVNDGLMHVTDWLPTLAHIANVPVDHLEIDGVDQYNTLFLDGGSSREEILLNLDPPGVFWGAFPFMGQAAIRYQEWKLIVGLPNCSLSDNARIPHDYCPDGWITVNRTLLPAPDNSSMLWLFNLDIDPLETHNVADVHPSLVAFLRERIESYNSTHIPQAAPLFDRKSCPRGEPGKRVWLPWK